MTSGATVLTAAPPLWRSVPLAPSSAGLEAVELAASAGLILDDWQSAGLVDALGERPDGRWASFEVGVICTRQNGKGAMIEARELAGLVLLDEELIMHSAHEFKTASEAFRRILYLFESTPDLDRLVRRVTTANGNEGIELRSGSRLRFVARSKGSGRGFSGDCVILDEAYNLSPAAMSALVPTMSAMPNPQLWYTSSAPLDTAESFVLRQFCKRGRAGDPSMTYLEWCAGSTDPDAPPPDLDDRAQWRQANPGMSTGRITEEFTERERATLTPDDFARERLGIWRDPDDDPDRIIPGTDWAKCCDPDAPRSDLVAYAIDASPDLKSAAIGASDGTFGLVREHGPGVGWVVPKLVELGIEKVLLDPRGPAGALITDLTEADIEVVEVSPADHAQACGYFLGAVIGDTFRHSGQSPLDAAVAGATRRPYGDSWAWNRRTATVDISPLVAVTLARWGAAQTETETPFFGAWR